MRRATTALLALLLLLSGAPAQAAPEVCGPGPVELATGGEALLVAGGEHVQGYVLRRRLGGGRTCVVPGATVELFARTKNTTQVVRVRTDTTDADGRVQFRVRPPYTTVLTARSAATPDVPAADAPAAVLRVGVRVSLTARVVAACGVDVSGRTFPAKPGSLVEFGDLGRVRVGADGTYRGVVPQACERTPLSGFVASTQRNEYGITAPQEQPDPTPRTCGTGATGAGPPGLTQRLEVFNTTTPVGGAWHGERVVANPTDRPVTFSSGRHFTATEPYRLLRSGTHAVLGHERFTDGGQGPSEQTLQPGEELRTPVVLAARNCEAEHQPGSFESRYGPPLPPGRVVGTSILLIGNGTPWASDRVALDVG